MGFSKWGIVIVSLKIQAVPGKLMKPPKLILRYILDTEILENAIWGKKELFFVSQLMIPPCTV